MLRKMPSLDASAEFRLLAACCLWGFGGGNALEVKRLAKVAAPDRVQALARRHRISGLVWHAIEGVGEAVPTPLADALAEDARRNAEQGLASAAMSRTLLDGFDRADIPLLFLKGHTIGRLAWDNPFLKTSWDIDVLVPPDDIRRSAELIDDLGFRRRVPTGGVSIEEWHRTNKESVWLSPAGLHLDLHSRLADAPQLLPAIDARSPRQEVPILPGLSLPTLADQELFAYLCVHGASSAWFRMKWIADLAGFIRHRSPGELEGLFERSQKYGAGRAVHQALLLTARLFGPLASPALQRSLEADTVARLLCEVASRELLEEREPTERPLGTAMIHLSQLALLPGPRFAASEFLRQVRAATGG